MSSSPYKPSWQKGRTGGKRQSTFLCFRKLTHPKGPFSPDVQTAEGGKENSRSKGQGDSQEHCQELVNHVFADFKEGMTADPHFVQGVRRLGLCDHVLEAHLRRQDSGILTVTQYAALGARGLRAEEERRTWLGSPTFS